MLIKISKRIKIKFSYFIPLHFKIYVATRLSFLLSNVRGYDNNNNKLAPCFLSRFYSLSLQCLLFKSLSCFLFNLLALNLLRNTQELKGCSRQENQAMRQSVRTLKT